MKDIEIHRDNLAKHGVSLEEVRECLSAGKRQYKRKAGRDVYRVIGRRAAGRYLELLYADRPDVLFVFHAMDARPRDIRLFKRKGKRR